MSSPKRRCTATTRAGQPCRAWAVQDTDPPRCAAHGGLSAGAGAPPGSRGAVGHGFYAAFDLDPEQVLTPINGIIHDLATKQAQLSALISQCLESAADPDLGEVVKLLQIHGQNASRLGRLLRDKRALSGDSADGISAAIGQALDELGTQWGIDL